VFTRIVSVVVLISFALTTTQCAPALRLSREQIPLGGARATTQKIVAAELSSGEVIKFPGPGGRVAGPPWTLTGRDDRGVWREILFEDLLYVRVDAEVDALIAALVITGAAIGVLVLMARAAAMGS
jgi:hypothetical protein